MNGAWLVVIERMLVLSREAGVEMKRNAVPAAEIADDLALERHQVWAFTFRAALKHGCRSLHERLLCLKLRFHLCPLPTLKFVQSEGHIAANVPTRPIACGATRSACNDESFPKNMA